MADPNRPQNPDSAYIHQYHSPEAVGLSEKTPDADDELDQALWRIIQAASSEATTYVSNENRNKWQRSYRAYRNQHWTASKYNTPRWKARSKIFRPKTRAAVRKNMAMAASALFSTPDIITVAATNDDDETQRISAEVKQQLLAYRMDRTNERNGISWFMTSMGAVHDASVTGVCISKQYWEYESRIETEERPVEGVMMKPGFDEESGVFTLMPQTEPTDVEVIIKNKPGSDLFPPENVLIDPAAPWIDPAQSAGYLILRTPMHSHDVEHWIKQQEDNPDSPLEFLPFDPAILRKESNENSDARAVRDAREGGRDRYNELSTNIEGLDIVWLHENFVRYKGVDYQFWSIGDEHRLSRPIETEVVYPEQMGDRPVVWGYGSLEPHRVYPMSMVESIQPLQAEVNDMVNLRLDAIKNSISPPVKVRRGKRVDLKQVQNRGPDTVMQLDDLDDVSWDFVPDNTRSSYESEDRLNVDMDELTGSFGGSSVQSNRKLNETVGGMQMMQGSANSVSEFDLRTWIETYAEPVVRQVQRCIEYYESDEKALSIAGNRSKLMQKYGIDEVTDEMLESDVLTRMNVGIGAIDPQMQVNKLQQGFSLLSSIFGPKFIQTTKSDEVTKEVMGKLGYKDAERFIDLEKLRKLDEGPSEEVQALQKQVQQLTQQLQDEARKEQARSQGNIANTQAKGEIEMAKEQMRAEHSTQETKRKLRTSLAETMLGNAHDLERDEISAASKAELELSKQLFGGGGSESNNGPSTGTS